MPVNYRVEAGKVERHRITVIYTPSRLFRLLGFRPSENVYEGTSTVWYGFPSGVRCSLSQECEFVSVVKRFEMMSSEVE